MIGKIKLHKVREDTQKVFSNGRTTKTFRTTKNKPLKEKVMKNENYKPLRGGGTVKRTSFFNGPGLLNDLIYINH